MDRRTALETMIGCVAASLALGAVAADDKATVFRELTWPMLMPKDWNPRQGLGPPNESLDDSDPRAQQYLRDLREVLDKAPTVGALDGATVKMPGYVVALEQTKEGLKEFLLVPYFGACIHTPPPPANQIVHVRSAKPVAGLNPMEAVWVSGTMRTQRRDSGMGVSGYELELVSMTPYRWR